MKAVEVTGIVDDSGQLCLDQPLSVVGSKRVRIIVLFSEDENDIEKSEWLKAAASNLVFDFLKDPEEDIYTIYDGKPLND